MEFGLEIKSLIQLGAGLDTAPKASFEEAIRSFHVPDWLMGPVEVRLWAFHKAYVVTEEDGHKKIVKPPKECLVDCIVF